MSGDVSGVALTALPPCAAQAAAGAEEEAAPAIWCSGGAVVSAHVPAGMRVGDVASGVAVTAQAAGAPTSTMSTTVGA